MENNGPFVPERSHAAGKMSQHIISVNKVKDRQSSPFQGQAMEFADTFFFFFNVDWLFHGIISICTRKQRERDHLKNTLVWVNSTKIVSYFVNSSE